MKKAAISSVESMLLFCLDEVIALSADSVMLFAEFPNS